VKWKVLVFSPPFFFPLSLSATCLMLIDERSRPEPLSGSRSSLTLPPFFPGDSPSLHDHPRQRSEPPPSHEQQTLWTISTRLFLLLQGSPYFVRHAREERTVCSRSPKPLPPFPPPSWQVFLSMPLSLPEESPPPPLPGKASTR